MFQCQTLVVERGELHAPLSARTHTHTPTLTHTRTRTHTHTHTQTHNPQDYLQGLVEPGLSQLLHDKEETILSMQSSLEEGEKEKLRLNEQLAELKR